MCHVLKEAFPGTIVFGKRATWFLCRQVAPWGSSQFQNQNRTSLTRNTTLAMINEMHLLSATVLFMVEFVCYKYLKLSQYQYMNWSCVHPVKRSICCDGWFCWTCHRSKNTTESGPEKKNGCFSTILWIYILPPPSNSGKWRFIGIPSKKCDSPSGSLLLRGEVNPNRTTILSMDAKNKWATKKTLLLSIIITGCLLGILISWCVAIPT